MAGAARRVQALVVGRLDYGEADRILRLLTPELGRVSVLAHGARRSRRLGAALELGSRLDLELRPGRGELWSLGRLLAVRGRPGLRRDLHRLALLAYACELVGAFAREGEPAPRPFGLLDTFLLLLDGLEAGSPLSALRAGLEAKALAYAGFRPVLSRCAACGGALDGPARFDLAAGGSVHPDCGSGPELPPAFRRALDYALHHRLAELVDLELPPGPRGVLADFAEYHLGHPLRSRAWLESVEDGAGR